jgi:hypothetical protein
MHDIEKVSAEHRSELEAEAPDEEVLKIDEQRADKRAVYEDVTAWRRLPGALKLLLGGAVKCRYQCRYHTTRTTSYLSPFTFHLCALCQPKMSSWIAPLRPGLSTVIITVSYWAILIAPAMLPVGAPAQAQHSSIRSPPTFTILQSTTYLHNTPIRRLTVWFTTYLHNTPIHHLPSQYSNPPPTFTILQSATYLHNTPIHHLPSQYSNPPPTFTILQSTV